MQHQHFTITEREQGILSFLSQGKSTKDIASKLGISTRTVEGHRRNLLMKFRVKNSIEMIVFAIKNDIIKTEDIDKKKVIKHKKIIIISHE